MFYNGKNVDISKRVLNCIKSEIDLDVDSSNVLLFYINENINSFIGNGQVSSKDVSFSRNGLSFLITTIFDRKIRIGITLASDYLLKIAGECLDDKDRVVETFSITKCGEKMINDCTCQNGGYSYCYYADVSSREASLSKGKTSDESKDFIVKATPMSANSDDSYLYALESVMPKPRNGSYMKKFVDLVRSDLNMDSSSYESSDGFDIEIINELFSTLKDDISEKSKRGKVIIKD